MIKDSCGTQISLKLSNSKIFSVKLNLMIVQASQTIHGALNRTESRGAHARDDYPNRDDVKFMKHTNSTIPDLKSGKVKLEYRDVRMYTLDEKEFPVVPPAKRVY